MNLIIIKLGGSVITDKKKPFSPRKKEILRLAKELEKIYKQSNTKLIITHGSGSFGHTPATKYKTHKGIINKNSIRGLKETAYAALKINEIVMEEFQKTSLNVVSLQPRSFIVSKGQRTKSVNIEAVKEALSLSLVPVVFGDVIFDESQGFCIYSADKIISILVSKLYKIYKIQKIIYLTDTDGVYDQQGETIKLVTQKNFDEVRSAIGESNAPDVTGGMFGKVKESLNLSKRYKIPIYIMNGNKKGNIMKLITGGKRKEVKYTKIIA